MGCNFVFRLAINKKTFVGYRRWLDLQSYDLFREVKVLFLSENTKTLSKTNFWFVIKVHTRLKGRGEAFRMYSYKVFVKEFHHMKCITVHLLTLSGFSIQIRKWCIQWLDSTECRKLVWGKPKGHNPSKKLGLVDSCGQIRELKTR